MAGHYRGARKIRGRSASARWSRQSRSSMRPDRSRYPAGPALVSSSAPIFRSTRRRGHRGPAGTRIRTAGQNALRKGDRQPESSSAFVEQAPQKKQNRISHRIAHRLAARGGYGDGHGQTCFEGRQKTPGIGAGDAKLEAVGFRSGNPPLAGPHFRAPVPRSVGKKGMLAAFLRWEGGRRDTKPPNSEAILRHLPVRGAKTPVGTAEGWRELIFEEKYMRLG